MGKIVLVVDDSLFMRSVVKSALTRAGYEVIEFGSSKEGLELLQNQRVNLIISDLNMPEMDGLTLVKKIREGFTNKFTPILMLTTVTDEDKKQEGKVAGANGWITKPFDPKFLLDAVTKAVR